MASWTDDVPAGAGLRRARRSIPRRLLGLKCVYCGARCEKPQYLACSAHADLPRNDPPYAPGKARR